MRILIVTTDYLPNVSGIATLCYEQAASLAAAGHTVCVATTIPGAETHSAEGAFEVLVHKSPAKPVLRLCSLGKFLQAAIAGFNPDFVWCANYRGYGLPVMIHGRKNNIPYGLYIHGTEVITEGKSLLRRLVFKRVLSGAATVITNSHYTASLVRTKFKIPALPVTPGVYPVPADTQYLEHQALQIRQQWTADVGAPEDTIIMISCCRIAPEKGIDLVIRSIAMLPQKLRNRVLYVVGGSGPWAASFQELSKTLGVENQVKFIGYTARENLPATLKAADVYLQPSQPYGDYIEGFGISFMEAQMVGLPCIASDWAGTPEAIVKDKTGLLVPTGSAEAIAEAISKAILDTDWRARASEEAARWAAGNSWTNHAATLEQFLTSAANQPAQETP